MFAKIVACVDSDPPGQHAGSTAVEVAARFKCELILLTVLPWARKDAQPDLERLIPMGPEGRTIHQMMEETQNAALARGIPKVETALLRGNPADAILAYLEKSPPDLVVVGTRGLSRGSRVLLGSVSSRLVTEAPCPVLVVRTVARRAKHTAA